MPRPGAAAVLASHVVFRIKTTTAIVATVMAIDSLTAAFLAFLAKHRRTTARTLTIDF